MLLRVIGFLGILLAIALVSEPGGGQTSDEGSTAEQQLSTRPISLTRADSTAPSRWIERLSAPAPGSEVLDRIEAVAAPTLPTLEPASWASAPRRDDDDSEPPTVSASAAAIVDEASASVLWGKHDRLLLPPASLTKVATAILAIESGQLDEWVETDVDSRAMPGSSVMGLLPGDEFMLEDLVYGLMLRSGNDAALAIGRFLSGSDAAFVDELNAMMQRIGLRDSHFTDAHGLGGPDHYTSARDLAMLSRYAMQLPEFREIVGARKWEAEGSRTIEMENLNPFLDLYEGADGLKTGFTYEAGRTFIGSATRQGHRVYVVLLNSEDRFGEAATLLDWAFEHHDWPRLTARRR